MGKTHKYNSFLLTALALVLACTRVHAQQEPMYTQFFSNQLVLNPAYAGSRDGLSLVTMFRQQWVGFKGAPSTQTLSAHAPISNSSGVGVNLIHDRIGITDQFILNGVYAFRFDLGPGRLAFGLQGQVRRRQMDWASTNPLNPTDNTFNYTTRNLFLPNFGAGLHYDIPDRFYFGFAMPQMLENALNYAPNNPNQNLAQLRRHYYVMSGVVLGISDQVKLRPAFLVKYVQNSPVEVDVNLGVVIKERLTVGGTYRSGDSNDFFLQYQLSDKLRMGYAYDFAYTRLLPYNLGSHELMIGIDLGQRLRGFDHPRYF
jgi:type IX secretion system PorP/SprF family membrane protein